MSDSLEMVFGGFFFSGNRKHLWEYKWTNVQHLVLFSLVTLLVHQTTAQLSEGDRCRTHLGEPGICSTFEKCPKAKEMLTTSNVRPLICSFNLRIPIICCGEANQIRQSEIPIRRPVNNIPSQPDRFPSNGGLSPGVIAERKCEEYTKSVTKLIHAVPLALDSQPVSFKVDNCPYSGLKLIVGGAPAERQEFPHMAAIGYPKEGEPGYTWQCGGSLISNDFVLSAAHCVSSSHRRLAEVVRLGELNLDKEDPDKQLFHPPGYSKIQGGNNIGDYRIKDIIRHPEYNISFKYNDLVLFRLERPVSFSSYVRPACLYTKSTFRNNQAIATGWGRIAFYDDDSDILLKVQLEIYDNRECDQLYSDQKALKELHKGIVPTMMCAGYRNGGKDSCSGDSGGPLGIHSPDNKCIHYIIGVTSFGTYCGLSTRPGVYTRVSSYIPWIEKIVWPFG